MYYGLLHTHTLAVTLFLLLYLVKSVLLVAGKTATLQKVTAKTKVPEMIISFLFLATGIGLMFLIPNISTMLIIKIVIVLVSIPVAVIGFKKQNKLLGPLSFVLILAAYGLAEMSKAVKEKELVAEVVTDPGATGYDKVAHGKAIYQTYCQSCHGEAGNAQLAGAKNLQVSELTGEEVYQIIKNGKGAMRGYEKVLDESALQAVLTYAMSLRTEQ